MLYTNTKSRNVNNMKVLHMKHICNVCGWEYREERGYPFANIKPNTSWTEVPEDFYCPLCGASKDKFRGDTDSQSQNPQ